MTKSSSSANSFSNGVAHWPSRVALPFSVLPVHPPPRPRLLPAYIVQGLMSGCIEITSSRNPSGENLKPCALFAPKTGGDLGLGTGWPLKLKIATPRLCRGFSSIILHHSKLVPNRRSPISPNPGFTYPLASKSGSIPPTNTSVVSGYALATFSRPSALPSKENNVMWSTPQSLHDELAAASRLRHLRTYFKISIAALAVPPVATSGSRMYALLIKGLFRGSLL